MRPQLLDFLKQPPDTHTSREETSSRMLALAKELGMKTFRFPLQRVLEWRALQLRVEEEKLAALQQQLTSLLQMREKLASERNRSQSHLFASGTAAGSDLQTWALYQARLVKQQELLKTQLLQCEKLTLEQRQRLLKARTDHRVLERLKERRWRQWVYLNDREQEDTAAEVYLSKWSREDLENKSAEAPVNRHAAGLFSGPAIAAAICSSLR